MVSNMFRHASTSRWLTLCILGIATAFLVNLFYSRKVSADVDRYVRSITENSAASVVYLAAVTEDIRLISSRAMQARPESSAADRSSIAGWVTDMDQAIEAYRMAKDDPGEEAAYRDAERLRTPFLAAVDRALQTAGDATAVHGASLEQLGAAADSLAAQVRQLTRLNADQVASEGAAINRIRHRARTILAVLRAATAGLSLLGILLSWVASRQHVALAKNSQRLAEVRAQELEMFAGRVAHDLRNPLAVIEMKTAIAVRHEATPALRALLHAIRRQGHRMNEIIDALLTFAVAGATPEPDRCPNIEEVAREVISDQLALVSETNIDFVIDPIPPATAACSPRVLSIVLANLVGNAAKYIDGGTQGARRITLRLEDREERLRFEVEDTGPGLPTGKESLVFQPFVRFSRSSKGVGLGLATVKRLVEAHRGKVGVESVTGSGCRFWFELPKADTLSATGPRSKPSSTTAARQA